MADHEVSIRVGDRVINRWTEYSIEVDLMNPGDSFSLSIAPGRQDIWNLVAPDTEVEVRIDDNAIITGYIDERDFDTAKSEGATISVGGRDKIGRMLDESADLQTFPRLSLTQLATRLARPDFASVTLSNARNRDLVRGRRSGKAERGTQAIVDKASDAPRKVEPGQTRYEVLAQFLEPARLLAWSSGDGRELIVGLPDQTQGIQNKFFAPKENSERVQLGNVRATNYTESLANAYSEIRVSGASKGNANDYGARVTKRTATATDGDEIFLRRKQLIISDDDVSSIADAEERAFRELDHRNAGIRTLELTVAGHSQRRFRSDSAAIFAVDTMADVEIEELGIRGLWLVVACSYRANKQSGEETVLRLVPQGTTLVA